MIMDTIDAESLIRKPGRTSLKKVPMTLSRGFFDESRLTHDDLNKIQWLGRVWMRNGNPEAIEKAAQYLATCINHQEKQQVRYWWVEGVRDFVIDHKTVADASADLEARARELTQEEQ